MPERAGVIGMGAAMRLEAGALTLTAEDAAVRGAAFGGVEVLKRIDYPVRDADR